MLKKVFAVILSVIMILCVSLTVFAEDNESPPELHSGDFASSDGSSMKPPEGQDGQPPEKPDGDGFNLSDGGSQAATNAGGAPGGTGGFGGGTPPGGSTSSFEYAASMEITEADAQSGQTYTSDTADVSALMISTADAVTVTDPTVTKTGDSDGGDYRRNH